MPQRYRSRSSQRPAEVGRAPGFGDEISRTAQQVRRYGTPTVHHLQRTLRLDTGRAYRTRCGLEIPTQAATLTTADADCGLCDGWLGKMADPW